MKRTLFPGYSVGTDAYEDIKEICPAYGKKAAIIGGKHALAAAQDKIIAAAKEELKLSVRSGTAARHRSRILRCSSQKLRTRT